MTLKANQSGQRQGTTMGAAMDDARATQGSQQASGGQSNYEAEQMQWGFRGMGGMFDLPAAADTQSEVLTKSISILKTDIGQLQDQTFEITLEGMDRENPNLNISASVLVLLVQRKRAPQNGIGYHTMVLAASTPEPGSKTVLLPNNKSVDLKETVGDLFDGVMRAEIHRELSRLYPGVKLFAGEARVVPADFKWDDQGAVKNLRAEVVTAAGMTLIKNEPNFEDINLRKLKKDNSLSVNTAFGQPQIINSVGQPVRGDIRVTFRTGTAPRQGEQDSANVQKVQDLSSIAAYIDLIHLRQASTNPYLPPQQQAQYGGQQVNPNQFKQFIARLVITRMRSTRAPTLNQQLLSLLTCYTLRKPGAWYPNFKPNYHMGREKDIDLKDIGVIGLETMPNPDGSGGFIRVPTKVDSFTPQALGMLLHATVQEGLVVSLDVEECGEDTWLNSIFADAAQTQDSVAREKAYSTLYGAVDWLTDGEFAKLFTKGEIICFNENNRIQNGFYTGKGGERADDRDLDLLAMYNLMGDRDIKVPRDWNDSFILSDFPIEQRLDARLALMHQLMPDLKITGYSRRITFTDKFLQAFTHAAEKTGLQVREVNAFNDTQGYEVPTYRFADQALGGYQNNNLFTQGAMSASGGQQMRPTGRWG
ncbi:MAG: hypothetical protein P4L77_10995 [Sulfuriferula sp.]|nr:hypothetical protein [Sulfuriferula sp.]